MEFALEVIGAFGTLPGPTVSDSALLEELAGNRGLNRQDALLAIDEALMQGILVRATGGELRLGAEALAHRVDAPPGPAS